MNLSPVARLKKTWSKVKTAKFDVLEVGAWVWCRHPTRRPQGPGPSFPSAPGWQAEDRCQHLTEVTPLSEQSSHTSLSNVSWSLSPGWLGGRETRSPVALSTESIFLQNICVSWGKWVWEVLGTPEEGRGRGIMGVGRTAAAKVSRTLGSAGTWSRAPPGGLRLSSSPQSCPQHHMDPSSNFCNYRTALQGATQRSQTANSSREKIVIPVFNLFVKDIYFLHKIHTNHLPNGHINFKVPAWRGQRPHVLVPSGAPEGHQGGLLSGCEV